MDLELLAVAYNGHIRESIRIVVAVYFVRSSRAMLEFSYLPSQGREKPLGWLRRHLDRDKLVRKGAG